MSRGGTRLTLTALFPISARIADRGDSAAIAAGINLTSYTRHVYLFPRNSGSSLYGAGTMGGNPSQTWLNGQTRPMAPRA